MNKKTISNKIMSAWVIFLMIATCFMFSVSVKALSISDVDAQYHLNELSGTSVADSSGNGYGMTIAGSGSSWVAGKLNNAFQTAGTGYIQANGNTVGAYTESSTFSVEFWAYSTNFVYTSGCGIVSKHQNGGDEQGWTLGFQPDGRLRLYMSETAVGGGAMSVRGAGIPSNSNWHHFVMTYNNNILSGVHFYLDGVDTGQNSASCTLTGGNIATTTHLAIGYDTRTGQIFNGKIDEVVLYDKVLSQSDVDLRYNSGAGMEGFIIGNDPPVVSNPNPSDGATGVDPRYVNYTVDIDDPDGDSFNYSITCTESGGGYIDAIADFGVTNGSFYLNLTGQLDVLTTYNVSILVVDVNGSDVYDYNFTTMSYWETKPVFSSESPTNETTCEPLTSDFSVDIDSPTGSGMNVNITTTAISGNLLDQTYNASGTQYVSVAGATWYSESFTVASSGWISQIQLYLKRTGTTIGNCNVYLYESFGGKPTTLVSSADPVDGDTISTSYQWVTFTFNTPVYSSVHQFHIVVSLPSSGAGDYLWWSSVGTNQYSGGNLAGSTNSGSSWTAYANNDASFKQYYQTHTIMTTLWSSYSGTNGTYTNIISPLDSEYNYTTVVSAYSHFSNYTNASYWFTSGDNTAPYYSGLTITNGSSGISVSPSWSITITDDESVFDYNISCDGQYDVGTGVTSGVKTLALTGLLYDALYTVYVNVTDYGGSSCPPISMSWSFTFTTGNADAPLVTWLSPLSSPVEISNPDNMYINVTWNMTDPNGLTMDYVVTCDNGDSDLGWGVSNGSYYFNLTTAIALGTTYYVWLNVTNGFNASNVTLSFTTRTNIPIVLGISSPANNSVGVPVGGNWIIPFTDADIYSDSVNVSIEISNGDSYSAWLTAPNSGLCAYSGLAYLTTYTVWTNTTDEWNSSVNKISYFTTGAYSMGGTPYLVYNTNQTFSFKDSNGTELMFTDIHFTHWYYNITDITIMTYYIHGGDLTINFTSLMVFEPFDITFTVDSSLLYQDYTNSFLAGDHATHTIVLIKRVQDYTFDNVLNRTWNDPEWIGLATDHKNYYIGQEIVFKYRIPSATFSQGYSLVIHKSPDWISGGGFWGTGSIFDDSVWRNPSTLPPLTLDYGQWITMVLDPSTFTGGYPSVDTEYRINLAKDDAYYWFWNDIPTNTGLSFTLLNIPLTPIGVLGTPSPADPDVGTTVTFTYTTNNNGQIEIDDLFKSGATETYPFEVNDLVFTHEFNIPSVYRINLRIWDGDSFVIADSIPAFYVNSTTGNETYGWHVEYLDPERKMIVAGLHPLEFVYSTQKIGTTKFVIKNPDGDTTRYSTEINSPARGTYSHAFPSNVPIGEWTVTMYANETFSFNFSVVADENNYIDFVKLEYYEGDQFQVFVVHNVKCLLKFYKYDTSTKSFIGRGEKTFIEKDIPNGIVTIEHGIVEPSSGTWKVEMWECDNRIEIRKLAEYTCTVIVSPVESPIIPPTSTIFPAVEGTLGFVIGLIITLFCLLIPFIVSKALGGNIQVPSLVYAFTCGLGLVISVAFGFFPVWVLAFMLVLGVIILIILYLMGKSSSGSTGV